MGDMDLGVVAEPVWAVADVQLLLLLQKISVVCLLAIIAITAILIFTIGFNSKR